MRFELSELAEQRLSGTPRGITSVCSAHPTVIRAALRHGVQNGANVLIEATCNQVNHLGGYTGMQPADFVDLVKQIAGQEGCEPAQLILGGDHLGPNPWRHLPSEDAMAKADAMMAAYVAAGFRKLHVDASMGCAGEPTALDDETTASRAARLATIAESEARKAGGDMPVYIIGTEVPPPGGADHALDKIIPTTPEAARQTIAVHRSVFGDAKLGAALERVIGLVVQPGVEFGNHNVIGYDRAKAQQLIRVLKDEPTLVFEAHSTDYQGSVPLSELVQDGFTILKVGPELTFVLREALYALDLIASDLLPEYGNRPLFHAMEAAMLADPGNWNHHYTGDEVRILRHYSLSDRIRYYWNLPSAQKAVGRLMQALTGQPIPIPLFWQHLPGAEQFADSPLDPEEVLIWRVTRSLQAYHAGCNLDA